jgi:hypothetical protein
MIAFYKHKFLLLLHYFVCLNCGEGITHKKYIGTIKQSINSIQKPPALPAGN